MKRQNALPILRRKKNWLAVAAAVLLLMVSVTLLDKAVADDREKIDDVYREMDVHFILNAGRRSLATGFSVRLKVLRELQHWEYFENFGCSDIWTEVFTEKKNHGGMLSIFWTPDPAAAGIRALEGDLIDFLTEQTVVKTTAQVSTLDKRGPDGELIGVDDNAFCIYEMSGGIMGTMTVSWTYYGAEDNSTILYGEKGIMRIYDDPAHSIVVTLADGTKISYDVEKIQTNDNQTKSGVIDMWMDCLTTNTPPVISGESALAAMRAVFASIRSSELGQAVEIPENC